MKSYEISSSQNDTYKMFLSLTGSKGIQEHGQALIYGKKAVHETICRFPKFCRGLISDFKSDAGTKNSLTIYRLKNELFKELDIVGSGAPILLVDVPESKGWTQSTKVNGCELVLAFQNPSNMGAVLRSAAAFGVKRIILLSGAAHPFHPKSTRAASASLFSFEYFRGPEITQFEWGSHVLVALDMGGENISDFHFPPNFLLLPGVEGPGLPSGIKPTHRVRIPIAEGVESLNAVVAASIALFQKAMSFQR